MKMCCKLQKKTFLDTLKKLYIAVFSKLGGRKRIFSSVAIFMLYEVINSHIKKMEYFCVICYITIWHLIKVMLTDPEIFFSFLINAYLPQRGIRF